MTKHRRGHNEGSIYQRKDGRWVASQTLEGRKRISYYGKTRAEAAAKLTVGLKSVQDGLPVGQDGRKTVEAFLKDWLADLNAQVKPKTLVTYEGLVRLHMIPAIGKVKLVKLGPDDLQRMYSGRIAAGLSPQSVRHIHAVLHRALEQAVRWNMVARNVVDLVTPPKATRKEMKTFTPEQARIFMEAARGDRLGAIYTLAVSTGMRQGELLALRWKDVDLERGTVQVTGTLSRGKDGLTIGAPKTTGSRRNITLGAVAIEALRDHRVKQNAERLALGSAWESNDFVFANEVGRPIDATNLLRRSYKPLLKAAALPEIRFHDLRHSAATLLLGQGIHPKVVSEMLGHSQVGITLNLYSHVTPTMQRQAADAMDAILR